MIRSRAPGRIHKVGHAARTGEKTRANVKAPLFGAGSGMTLGVSAVAAHRRVWG